MRMMIFLTTQPLWLSGAILVGLVTLAAMAGPVVVRQVCDGGRSLRSVIGLCSDCRLGEIQRRGA